MLLSQMSNPASRDLNKTQTHPKLEYDEVVPDNDDDSTEERMQRPAPARPLGGSLATSLESIVVAACRLGTVRYRVRV